MRNFISEDNIEQALLQNDSHAALIIEKLEMQYGKDDCQIPS